MDQATFDEMLKTALKEKLTITLEQLPDNLFGGNPDQITVTFLFDNEPIGKFVLNPLF
jgi:hypothetical protein